MVLNINTYHWWKVLPALEILNDSTNLQSNQENKHLVTTPEFMVVFYDLAKIKCPKCNLRK